MIEDFVQENLTKELKSFETLIDLYARYTRYCEINNVEPVIRTRFNNALDGMNFGVRHKKTVNYKVLTGRQGVRLLPCKY